MSIHPRLPQFLPISIPIPSARPRGLYSLGALSVAYSVRLDPILLERLNKRAAELDITAAEFIRWCTEQMLNGIDRYIDNEPLWLEIRDKTRVPENAAELHEANKEVIEVTQKHLEKRNEQRIKREDRSAKARQRAKDEQREYELVREAERKRTIEEQRRKRSLTPEEQRELERKNLAKRLAAKDSGEHGT